VEKENTFICELTSVKLHNWKYIWANASH